MSRFYARREYVKKGLRVQVGFRNSDLEARIIHPDGTTLGFPLTTLYDLADLAAEACDQQDDDPLL